MIPQTLLQFFALGNFPLPSTSPVSQVDRTILTSVDKRIPSVTDRNLNAAGKNLEVSPSIYASIKSVEHTNFVGGEMTANPPSILGHFCSRTIGQRATGLQLKALCCAACQRSSSRQEKAPLTLAFSHNKWPKSALCLNTCKSIAVMDLI